MYAETGAIVSIHSLCMMVQMPVVVSNNEVKHTAVPIPPDSGLEALLGQKIFVMGSTLVRIGSIHPVKPQGLREPTSLGPNH